MSTRRMTVFVQVWPSREEISKNNLKVLYKAVEGQICSGMSFFHCVRAKLPVY